MKNTIKYFYNMEIETIRQNQNRYIFNDARNIYSLENCAEYIKTIDDIYNLNKIMIYNNLMVYPIIMNKLNEIVTYINNIPYLLLKIDKFYLDKVGISDLLLTQYKVDETIVRGLKANNWKAMWSNKVDYFEYQVNQFGLNYPMIRESMGYFVGLAENAICMLNELKTQENDLYIQHRRIKCNSIKYDLMNPLNIIIDTRVRDLSEYYKSSFIDGKLELNSIYTHISNYHYNTIELSLLYIRMYFPTIYFDKYETIFLKQENEGEIQDVVVKIDEYEQFLRDLSHYIGQYIYIPNVEWIRGKNHKKT